jgi:glutamyl-Q tRNA(Asp) synthetase
LFGAYLGIWACSGRDRTLSERPPETVTRFAPSPTGNLHKGHAYSAILSHDFAKAHAGRFLVRIEDTDTTRCRPEFAEGILEDLDWLGLEFERPVRYQSEHLEDYEAAIENLRQRDLLYRCFRTRKQISEEMAFAPHGPVEPFFGSPLHPDSESQRLGNGDPFAWRLSLQSALSQLGGSALTFLESTAPGNLEPALLTARPELFGDIVLGRKDVRVAYHLAVVLDDALQGITHVIRGQDLAEATHIQRLLQALLGLPTPVYHHHNLIVGPDGRRLAKRDHSETLKSLRARGVTPAHLRADFGL